MSAPTEQPDSSSHRRFRDSYEDAHYHDEDEPLSEEDQPRLPRPVSKGQGPRRPSRRLPPPPRRFHED